MTVEAEPPGEPGGLFWGPFTGEFDIFNVLFSFAGGFVIFESLRKSFRLIGRSRSEAMLYLGVTLLASWLYVLFCGMMGLEGAYTRGADESSPLRSFFAYLPGVIILTWFATGIAGRMIMCALKGEAEEMGVYARGWYFRKLGWDVFFMLLMVVPVPLLAFGVPGVLLAICWVITGMWIGVRTALWLNFSVSENLRLVESLKRSYSMTDGWVWRLLLICFIPLILTKAVAWLGAKAIPGNVVFAYYVESLLEGVGILVVMGAFAAVYVKIKSLASEPEPVKAVDEVSPEES